MICHRKVVWVHNKCYFFIPWPEPATSTHWASGLPHLPFRCHWTICECQLEIYWWWSTFRTLCKSFILFCRILWELILHIFLPFRQCRLSEFEVGKAFTNVALLTFQAVTFHWLYFLTFLASELVLFFWEFPLVSSRKSSKAEYDDQYALHYSCTAHKSDLYFCTAMTSKQNWETPSDAPSFARTSDTWTCRWPTSRYFAYSISFADFISLDSLLKI